MPIYSKEDLTALTTHSYPLMYPWKILAYLPSLNRSPYCILLAVVHVSGCMTAAIFGSVGTMSGFESGSVFVSASLPAVMARLAEWNVGLDTLPR